LKQAPFNLGFCFKGSDGATCGTMSTTGSLFRQIVYASPVSLTSEMIRESFALAS